MKRFAVVLVFGVLCASISACNITSPAATVNGSQISLSSFQNELNLVNASSSVRCAFDLQTGTKLPQTGAAAGTIPTQVADAELTQLIELDLYNQELVHLKSPVTPTFLTYATQDLPELLTPSSGSSPCGLTGANLVSALPSWYVKQQERFLADEEQMVSVIGKVNLGPAGVQNFYNSNPTDFHYLCMNALAVSTQAEAKADYTKINDGTPFATVAATSLNAQLSQYGFSPNGAYQNCEPLEYIGTDQQNWAAALNQVKLKVDAVTQPFSDSSQVDENGTNAWVLLQITKKETQPLTSSLVTGIREYLVHENLNALSQEQSKLLAQANITVDPQFGSWKSNKVGLLSEVAAPAVPKPAYLLNRKTDSATS